ncbi:Omp28-related outer membrane protein [bacterium]|nr:Omp28-related outer membrane protein [bacterium]
MNLIEKASVVKSESYTMFFIYTLVFLIALFHAGTAVSGDNYEPNDSRETAYEISFSDGVWKSETATIDTREDADWYSFYGESDSFISISSDPITKFDIAFSLYYGDSRLTCADNYFSGMAEKIVKYPLGKDGIYYICVGTPESTKKRTTTDTDSFGSYSLEITLYKSHTISGKVTDSQTGNAISSARITVEHDTSYTAETDVDGMFEVILKGALSGEPFAIQVQKTGYIAEIAKGIVSNAKETAVSIELAPLPDNSRNVLLEEFTATWCTWCPYATDILEEIIRSQGNVISIAYHIEDEMSTPEGDQLDDMLSPALPQALIDRTQFTGSSSILVNRQEWTKRCIERSQVPAPLSIHISCDYTGSSRNADVTVDMLSLSDMKGAYRINVVVCEDSLDYEQHITGKDYKTISPYYHMHVVRRMITGTYGERLNTDPIQAQTNIRKYYSFTLDDSINENYARLVVFVNEDLKNGLGPVQQAAQCTIMEDTITEVEIDERIAFQIHPAFPNPFNTTTMIPFTLTQDKHIVLTVYNIVGEKVTTLTDRIWPPGKHSIIWDAHGFSSGIYFYRLQAGASIGTGKMLLIK